MRWVPGLGIVHRFDAPAAWIFPMNPRSFNLKPIDAMKLITIIALFAPSLPLFAEDDAKKAADPLAGAFFPPELIFLARDRIALTPEQRELYDLQADPRESNNLALEPKHAAEIAALRELLRRGPIAGESPIRAVLQGGGGDTGENRP